MQTEGRSGSQLIVIACQHAITTSLGPGIVKLAAQIGKTHVRLRSANRDACEALLLTRQADFSITYRIASDAAARSEALTDKVVIAAEKLIPVFRAERANEALWRFHNGDLDVIAYPSDVFLGMSMARHIVPTIESRCRLNVVAETALTSAALQLASAGIGVAWVPLALARDDLRYGRVRDLSEHLESLDMQIVVERRPEGAVGPQDRLWQRFTQGFEQAEAPVQAA